VALLETPEAIRDLLTRARRIAVLGIKPASAASPAASPAASSAASSAASPASSSAPAYAVPAFLQQHGYTIIPVPVYFPDVREILGVPVVRTVREITPPVDVVEVFRRPVDIPRHLDDLLAARPAAVWFQLGIRHDAVAAALVAAGIDVVQDRCMKVEVLRLDA